jgi:hypothetical protein
VGAVRVQAAVGLFDESRRDAAAAMRRRDREPVDGAAPAVPSDDDSADDF